MHFTTNEIAETEL